MKKILFLIAILSIPSSFVTAKTVNIEYILDASGSMLETIQDVRKIDIAKETLSGLVEQLPAGSSEIDLNVGLRVYGHSTVTGESPEERCRDTELEMPISGVDSAGIKKKIAEIQARGWTPIAYSLEQAAGDFLVGGDNDNIIILISDGKETCGGDPCAVAEKIHQAGIKVKINVVGFDIKPEEKAQLECIANVAGGKYYSADSAGELNQVLTEVQNNVIKKETTSVRIKIGGPGTLKFEVADWVPGAPYLVQIMSGDNKKEIARAENNLDPLMIPAGTYRLFWHQWRFDSLPIDMGEFTVASRETVTFPVNSGINLVPGKWLKTPPYRWYLKNPGTGEIVMDVNNTLDPVPVMPGVYDLHYQQWRFDSNEALMASGVEIKPGEITEVELNTGVTLIPSSPEMEPPYRWVLTDPETGNEVITVNKSWGPIPVPPGNYGLNFQQTRFKHSPIQLVPSFPVKEGQLVELEL